MTDSPHASTHRDLVVIGFDGSESAQRALSFAIAEARTRKAELRIVTGYVLQTPDVGFGTALPWDQNLVDAIREEAEQQVTDVAAATQAANPDLTVTGTSQPGPGAAVVLEEAQDATLIVVGSHGNEGFFGLLLGGVPRQIATHSRQPTIVVRPREADATGHVLVGIDGSPDSVRALGFAFDHASRHNLALTVVHTWEVPPIGAITGVPSPEPPTLLQNIADNELRASSEELAGYSERYPDVPVDISVVQGSPVKVLAEKSSDADLLVVGSRGRGGFLGLLLGSVSHGVLHHAHCPVAVVRGEK